MRFSAHSSNRSRGNESGFKRSPNIALGAAALGVGAFALTLVLSGSPSSRAMEGDFPGLALLPQESGKPAEKGDAVVLKDGTTVNGTLLDLTKDLVVLETEKGKQFFEREKTERVDRSADSKLIDFFKKYKSRAETEKQWRQLAEFCKKRTLRPEHRVCLRRLLEVNPDDFATRVTLGEALLNGEWLTEQEVAAKVKEGYELADGILTKVEGEKKSPTVVKKAEKIQTGIKIIPRKKLTERERTKMEREREKAAQNAARFRRKLEHEREGVDWVKRYKYRTDFFEIHSNTTYELTKRYGALMELIRAKLAGMFTSRIVRARIRAPVFVHRTQEDFMNTDLYGRWGGRGLGGYYMPSNQSIHTYHGTFGFTGTTYSVLAHEGTHYFQGLVLQGGFDNIPIWLIEGLAVYFGDGSRFDSKRKQIRVGLIPRDRLSHIQEKMLRKRHTRIEKLVGLTRYSGFSGSTYADSWALIYYLVKSSKKGENLMKEYWGRGLTQKLTKKDFLELAKKHFGSVEELEKQYVDFILKLRPPPAGQVNGEYFVCDAFQFEYKAPSDDWEFFEDEKDKKLVVGLLLPKSTAQIRIYYENNMYGKKPQEYMDEYLRRASFFENLKHEKTKIAGIPGWKLTYVDTGRGSLSSFDFEVGDDGEVVVVGEEEYRKKAGPRDVVKFMLIREDGICSIEASCKKGEIDTHADLFHKASENFGLLLTRRW